MGTPAFNDAADKIRREEAAADKAREAAESEKARAEMSARLPGASNTTAVLANTIDRAEGARYRDRQGRQSVSLEIGDKGPTRERALFDTVAASMGVDSTKGYTPDTEKKIRETLSLYSSVGAGQADPDVLKRTMAEPGYKAYAKEQDTFYRADREGDRTAADKAREAAESEKARMSLDEKYAQQDPKGARRDALRPVVGDPSGRTPAQADELAMIRASDEYTRAHRNYLERARSGESLFGVSSPDGSITSGKGTLWSPRTTAEGYRNNMDAPYGHSPLSEEMKQPPQSRNDAGGWGPTQSEYSANMVDNLARTEAIEAYAQERARAKRQSGK